MTYTEWRDELKNNLLSVSEAERKRVLEYYAEAYADRREAGFSETEIINEFGAPYDAAQRILNEDEGESGAARNREEAPMPERGEELNRAPVPERRETPEKPAVQAAPQGGQVQRTEAPKTEHGEKKRSKALWIVPVCVAPVVLVIVIALIVVLSLNHWFMMPEFEMAQYTALEEIKELTIKNSAGSVRTEYYEGEKVVVNYPVSDVFTMRIEEKDDGTLIVSGLKNKHWYNFISASNIPTTIIKIPQGSVLQLNVTVNAGSVSLAQGQFNEVDVTVNAGSLSSLGITCTQFTSKLNAGAISVASLKCEALNCKVSAGAFDIDSLTCPLVKVSVSAGSVGMNVKGKKEDYTILVDKSAGSCNVKSQTGTDPEKKIDIGVSAGSVSIAFVQ